MNLGRAKLVFIYAFLGLNLFLAYQLFWPNAYQLVRPIVSTHELQQIEAYLAQNNYYLEADINRAVDKSGFLTVSPDLAMQQSLMDYFAISRASLSEVDDYLLYQEAGLRIKFYPSGLTRFSWQSGEVIAADEEDLTEQALQQAAEQFLQTTNMKPDQARFDYTEKKANEGLVFSYYQSYNGMPLYAGYLRVYLEQKRVVAVEIYWLEPEEWPRERELEVINVAEALLKLAEELGPSPQPVFILKADFGFFSREYDAEKWEVPPVWRFIFEDGSIYYVNAFTGNLEIDL